MRTSPFKFQRLPSVNELNTLTPSTAYYGHSTGGDSPPYGVPRTTEDNFASLSGHNRSSSPKQSTPFTAYHVIGFIGHFVLTFSPIIFLMLAFAALSVNGKPLSQKGKTVLEASKVGPSLFPIVFAAVVGRLMRTFALWRAERGSTIGLLEQLNGSQNFLASIERAFHLRGLKGWSILIVTLWALSPIGGQSSLRVLKIGNALDSFSMPLSHFDTAAWGNTAFYGASDLTYFWPSVSAIFQACLLAPDEITLSSSDLWGNVKIPLMQTLPTYSGSIAQDWIVIPRDNQTVFSSLNGVPIDGLLSTTTTNLTVESSYFNFTCLDSDKFTSNDSSNEDFRKWSGPLLYHSNTSENIFAGTTTGWSSFMIDTTWNATSDGWNKSMNLIYASRNITVSYELTAYKCSVGFAHVESWVNCDGLSCYVDKMRPSRENLLSSVITPWNSVTAVPLLNFLSRFPIGAGSQHSAVTSPMDFYIAGSESPFESTLGYDSSDYTNVTGEQVAHRLGTLINTMWQTGNARTGLTTLDGEMTKLNVTGQVTVDSDVYAANMLWVGMTICISFILLGCGLAGMAFKYMSKAPDILGYVSTLAKDNPYFREHVGDDRLDGMDRARLLRDVMVQITDVKPWDERGHIALKSIARGSGPGTWSTQQPSSTDLFAES